MNNETLAFDVEWFDPAAQLVKELTMSYFEDGTIELLDKKTRKMFMKRIHCPEVNPVDLYIGSTVAVFQRQLNIVGYANSATQRKCEKSRQHAHLLVTGRAYNLIGKVLGEVQKAGIAVNELKMIRFDQKSLSGLESSGVSFTSSMKRDLLAEVAVSINLVLTDEKSRQASEAIDKKFAEEEAIYVSFGQQAAKEVSFIFKEAHFGTTACFDNATLCIIRPYVIKEGMAGQVIDSILQAGFEVSALQLFRLDRRQIEEFYDVYRGVIPHYEEVLSDFISGPCIAMEIRGPKVVEHFREWCGPHDPAIAEVLQPHCIRAKYGKSLTKSPVHATDLPEDGLLECKYFFKVLQS